MNFKVISTHVLSLTLLLADGTRVRCSRQDHPDLFIASLCSLGGTGLILQIQLEVGPAFRLKETQECIPFDSVVNNIDSIAQASEHVRFWWFPQADIIRVSSADRTFEVSLHLRLSGLHYSHRCHHQSRKPYATFLWHSLIGYHLVQLLLFIGRYLPFINPYICRFCAWLDRSKAVAVDDSWRVFNIDCKVSSTVLP